MGVRPGEKIHEELSSWEKSYILELKNYFFKFLNKCRLQQANKVR